MRFDQPEPCLYLQELQAAMSMPVPNWNDLCPDLLFKIAKIARNVEGI